MAFGMIGRNMQPVTSRDLGKMMQDLEGAKLLAGVQEGAINREEFVSLGGQTNRFAEQLEPAQGKDTVTLGGQQVQQPRTTRQERIGLIQANHDAFNNLYSRYAEGDLHPQPAGRDFLDRAQNRQMGQIFDDLRSGKVDMGRAMELLRAERQLSGERGKLATDGKLTGAEHPQLQQGAEALDRQIDGGC